jgi:hypothetical protein
MYQIDIKDITIKENSWIAAIASKRLKQPQMAIALGNTIYLHNTTKQEFLQNEKWVRHELKHVQQFRGHGYFVFILKYLWESICNGYHNNKYEIEARNAE